MGLGQGFKVEHAGLARSLITNAMVTAPFNPAELPRAQWPKPSKFLGIWDTGATNTVITQKVVDACVLSPTGMTKVVGVNGAHYSETYMVNLGLPNGVGFPYVKVTKGAFSGGDVLIGMDIISQGDFALTHRGGQTLFSFQHPTMAHIDFTLRGATAPNDRCPCGSGKKFKKCCGSIVRQGPEL